MGADLLLKGRRRDGTQFPADIALSPMSTQDGVLVVAAVRDMTGYQRAEAARRRLDLLSAMVESSEEAIFASTPEGIITSWNPAAEQMYGHRGKEIIGRSVELLTPWDRTGEMTAILARIRASEHLAPFETMRVRKDGTVFAAALTVSPIHDIDGTVIGASTIAHDSAKQQHAFDAARSMIEASLDLLVAISPEGNVLGVFAAARDVTNQKQDERKIAEQQANAMDRLAELERFHRLTVGREVNMIELKKEIEYLRMLDDIDGPERGEWR
jgi:PAS domain S-box-containing protein